MALDLYEDNTSETTLAEPLDNSEVAIDVTSATAIDGAGVPFALCITADSLTQCEWVRVTSITTNTLTVVRGAYGTTAITHSNGAKVRRGAPALVVQNANRVTLGVAMSDEVTALTTGTAKAVLHLPRAFTLELVFAEVNTVSSSGVVTVDINEGAGAGTTVLSTKLTIDASEETSDTAAAAAVISDSALAQYARLTFDIDTAGTGAKGLKVWLTGVWT